MSAVHRMQLHRVFRNDLLPTVLEFIFLCNHIFFVRKPTDLRFSLDLCPEERDYVAKRKQRIFETLRDKLGEEDGPQTIEEVSDIMGHFPIPRARVESHTSMYHKLYITNWLVEFCALISCLQYLQFTVLQ